LSLLCFFLYSVYDATASSSLSLHDALPISPQDRVVAWEALGVPQSRAAVRIERGAGHPRRRGAPQPARWARAYDPGSWGVEGCQDRKSTRLNSSHVKISYAVFCLKKKKHQT